MSKPRGLFGGFNTIFILIAAAVLGMLYAPLFVLLVFVPISLYYLWRINEKTKDLESRLAKVEPKPKNKKPEGS